MSKYITKIKQLNAARPNVIIADSRLAFEVEDFAKNGKYRSNQIQLMELQDASWSVEIRGNFYHTDGQYYTRFEFDFEGLPGSLIAGSSAIIDVSFDGTNKKSAEFNLLTTETVLLIPPPPPPTTRQASNQPQPIKKTSIVFDIHVILECAAPSKVIWQKFFDPAIIHKRNIRNISKLVVDPTFSDFTFNVQGKEFKLHKNILGAASSVMMQMFLTDLKEKKTNTCVIHAIKPEVFELLVRFIYCGEIPDNLVEFAMPLYEAAHYYEIDYLKEICVQDVHENLCAKNAVDIYEWAQPFDVVHLKADAWTIIKGEILKIFTPLEKEPLAMTEIVEIMEHLKCTTDFWKRFKKV